MFIYVPDKHNTRYCQVWTFGLALRKGHAGKILAHEAGDWRLKHAHAIQKWPDRHASDVRPPILATARAFPL
jgi:hypothetical protein